MNTTASPPIDLACLADVVPPSKRRTGTAALALGVSAAAATGGLLAWRFASVRAGRRHAAARPGLLAAAGFTAALGLARWQLQRLFAGEPEHEVEYRAGPIEIRRYAPLAIARTTVDATWDPAKDLGFRRLATFIFGGNRDKKKIAMTSPVTAIREGTGYRFAFVMPRGVALPLPDDPSVELDATPARRVAVLRFRGHYDEASIEAQKQRLLAATAEAGLVTRGEPWFAGYDPPSTLPILRRNEVWVELS